jgi:DNA-binding transcriptional MerR regulator
MGAGTARTQDATIAQAAIPGSAPPPAGSAPSESGPFTIGDLARAYGVTARTLRFYEDEGLLHPMRRGTVRLYSRADRARLAWILRGRNVGFSLKDIKELLDLYAPGPGRRTQLDAALQKSRERIRALVAQKADIEATIAELEHFCRNIEAEQARMAPSPRPSESKGES